MFEIVFKEVQWSVRGSFQTRAPSPEWNMTFWKMTIYSDTLYWSDITPFFFTILLIWTLLPNLTFYLIARYFHRTFATGATCQTEDTYSSGRLVLSNFMTCICSYVETNLSWTCLLSGRLSSEHPSVLLLFYLVQTTSITRALLFDDIHIADLITLLIQILMILMMLIFSEQKTNM